MFDDTVLDKHHSFATDLVRRQYSSNTCCVIQDIGVVTCVYVNRKFDQFWLIDYRIYDPAGGGKNKSARIDDMLTHTVYQSGLRLRSK